MCSNTKQTRSIFNLIGVRVKSKLEGFGLNIGLVEEKISDVGKQIGQKLSSFREHPRFQSFWESFNKYAAENPVMATTILALVISCAVPVTGFLSFALITLLGTFISFLCVEGTLLGIASAFLGGVLLIVCIFTLTVAFCGLVAYLVVSKLYTFATGLTGPQRYLAKLPLFGYPFVSTDTDHSGTDGDMKNGFEEEEDDDAASDEGIDSIEG